MPLWRNIAELQCQAAATTEEALESMHEVDEVCSSAGEESGGSQWGLLVRNLCQHAKQDKLMKELMDHTMTRLLPDASGFAPRGTRRPLLEEPSFGELAEFETPMYAETEMPLPQQLVEETSDVETSVEDEDIDGILAEVTNGSTCPSVSSVRFPVRVRAAPVVVPVWKGTTVLQTCLQMLQMESNNALQKPPEHDEVLEALQVVPSDIVDHGFEFSTQHNRSEGMVLQTLEVAPTEIVEHGCKFTTEHKRSEETSIEFQEHAAQAVQHLETLQLDKSVSEYCRETRREEIQEEDIMKVPPTPRSSCSSASCTREPDDENPSDLVEMAPARAIRVCASWEYPLSRREKELRLIELVDGAREIAEKENQKLKRRLSFGGSRNSWRPRSGRYSAEHKAEQLPQQHWDDASRAGKRLSHQFMLAQGRTGGA